MKRSVGALVVNNCRLISAGYNGTPVGFKNCFEKGCERCNSNAVILLKIINRIFNFSNFKLF